MYKTDKPLNIYKLEQGQSSELQYLIQRLQGQCTRDTTGKTLWAQEFAACDKPGKQPPP